MNDTTHLDLARPDPDSSPFDAIKRTDEAGEYWDGRSLMPLLDYDKWENFAEVIEKARVAIAAAGGDPDDHASRRQEASGRTRRANYRLTRYGAYITGMVGDVRKSAVGQALTYFAVRTREAEVAQPVALPAPDEEKAARVIAIFATAGVGDPAYWMAKAQQLAGRMLGEAPQYDPLTRPLTVQPFLASMGLSELEARKLSGTFGKKLKRLYIREYGAEPPTIDDLVGRHMVPIAQYREEHRPLFMQVWADVSPGRAS